MVKLKLLFTSAPFRSAPVMLTAEASYLFVKSMLFKAAAGRALSIATTYGVAGTVLV